MQATDPDGPRSLSIDVPLGVSTNGTSAVAEVAGWAWDARFVDAIVVHTPDHTIREGGEPAIESLMKLLPYVPDGAAVEIETDRASFAGARLGATELAFQVGRRDGSRQVAQLLFTSVGVTADAAGPDERSVR